VSGVKNAEETFAMRIMVSTLESQCCHTLNTKVLCFFAQAFFTIELVLHHEGNETRRFFPMVAGHKFKPAGLTSYGATKYCNPPLECIVFALTDDVCFKQASLQHYLAPTADGMCRTQVEGGFINKFEVIIQPEVGLLNTVDIEAGVKEAAVRVLERTRNTRLTTHWLCTHRKFISE
jgi:hypothetical protein